MNGKQEHRQTRDTRGTTPAAGHPQQAVRLPPAASVMQTTSGAPGAPTAFPCTGQHPCRRGGIAAKKTIQTRFDGEGSLAKPLGAPEHAEATHTHHIRNPYQHAHATRARTRVHGNHRPRSTNPNWRSSAATTPHATRTPTRRSSTARATGRPRRRGTSRPGARGWCCSRVGCWASAHCRGGSWKRGHRKRCLSLPAGAV